MKTLFEHLTAYADKKRASFAMPGHKGGRGFFEEFSENIARIDVTELDGTENLHSPGEVILAAKRKLSEIYKSEESFFLTGGSTEGIHIMLHSVFKKGRVLVNRGCHRSVINCCALSGMEPVFIPQKIHPELLIPMPPEPSEVKRLLEENEVDAVLITSPDYYGQLCDIEKFADLCHKNNIPLLVDEAHGAHLAAEGLFGGAIENGADMAVQSAHKTLNALNQAAFLHINSDLIDKKRVRSLTSMVGTTSPSYPIVASAELALSALIDDSWNTLCDYIDEKKEQLKKNTNIIMPTVSCDRARLVFGFSQYAVSGFEVSDIFSEKFGIDVEMADAHNVVMIATVSNTKEEIDLLFEAAEYVAQNTPGSAVGAKTEQPPFSVGVMSVRKAFLSEGEAVMLKEAVGRISKTTVCAYPPGIALIAFGEPIDEEMTEYITSLKEAGAHIDGLTPDGCIEVVKA